MATIEPIDETAWVDADRLNVIEVGGVELSIEIGAAFGHGQHPTTRLILDFLDLVDLGANRATDPMSVLDFGCGTGVLTLAALAAGAGRVKVVDDDPAALEVTKRNLERNRHLVDTSRVEVVAGLGDDETRRFDAVLVNVLLPVHQQQGPHLVSMLTRGGVIILSGVLEQQRSAVLAAYPELTIAEERRDGDWLGLVLSLGATASASHPSRRRS